MRKFNFAPPKMYRDIFIPGALLELATEIYAGKQRKDYKGLSVDEFAKVPALYGTIDPRESTILELEDEKVYKTSNNQEVFGADIKAITMLMYDKPRSAYIEFGRIKQCHESIYSGAVSYPMLGFKRFRNTAYSSWQKAFLGYAYINPENFELMNDSSKALEMAFKIDILLGNTFASTKYNVVNDCIEWNDKGYGLLLLSTLTGKGYRPDAETLNYLRVKGMGNYKGHFATTYGSARVDMSLQDNIDNDIVTMYNMATTPLRLLMSQRWAWYGNHRNTDMIMDLQDWDLEPVKYDTVSNVFTGLTPSGDSKGIGSHFGIGGKK